MKKSFLIVLILSFSFSGVSYSQKAPSYFKMYQNAKKYFRQGQYLQARILFNEVKKLALTDGTYGQTGPMIDYRIGLCYEKEGNYSKAIEHLEIYIDKANVVKGKMPPKYKVRQKIKKLTRLLNAKVNALRAKQLKAKKLKALKTMYKNAVNYWKIAKYGLAKSMFDVVLKNAIDLNLDKLSITKVTYYIGSCYENMQNYRKAIENYIRYSTYLSQGVKPPYTFPNKQTIEMKIQELTKKLVQGNEGNFSIRVRQLIRQGVAECRSNKFYNGLTSVRSAIALSKLENSYHPALEYYMGKCYEQQKAYKKAIYHYKLYLNAKTRLRGMFSKRLISSKIEYLKNKLSSMTAESQKLYKIKRLNYTYKRAHWYFGQRRFSEARRLYLNVKKMAINLNVYSPMIDYYIAKSYDYEGDYENALKHYQIYLQSPSKRKKISNSEVRQRTQILRSQLNSYISGNYASSGYNSSSSLANTSSTNPVPTEDSFMNSWWFYAGAITVGVVVLILVTNNGSSNSSAAAPAGYNPKPLGFTVFNF